MADPSRADFIQLVSSPMKPKDSELRWILVGLAVAFQGEVLVGNLVGGVGMLVVLSSWLGGILLFCVALFGLFRRRYSEAGVAFFALPVVLFAGWAAIAAWVAVWTWSPSWPAYQLGVIQASASLPLLAGIYAMNRKLSRTS